MNQIVSTKQLTPDGVWGYRKAIGAFVVVVVGLVVDAWADGSISLAEWKQIAIASVSAALATFVLPNAVKPTPPAHVDPPDAPGI